MKFFTLLALTVGICGMVGCASSNPVPNPENRRILHNIGGASRCEPVPFGKCEPLQGAENSGAFQSN